MDRCHQVSTAAIITGALLLGTLSVATSAAGLLIHQFTLWLRLLPCDADVSLNLLAGESSPLPGTT